MRIKHQHRYQIVQISRHTFNLGNVMDTVEKKQTKVDITKNDKTFLEVAS